MWCWMEAWYQVTKETTKNLKFAHIYYQKFCFKLKQFEDRFVQ